MSRDAEIEFVKSLASAFPSVRSLLDEHCGFYGEVLPHVFLGEVTRALVKLHAAPTRSREGTQLREVLAFLDDRFRDDPSVHELLTVSFLENLPAPEEEGHAIHALLGPNLKRAAQEMGWPLASE